MSNIKIDIIENGITTLATSGKYCDRNVDIEVNVPSSGDIEVEPIVLTGSQSQGCVTQMAQQYIKLFGDTISTEDITSAYSMFSNYELDKIPFDINMKADTAVDMSYMYSSSKIKELPKMYNVKPKDMGSLFHSCKYLKSIPDNYFDDWDFSEINSATSTYSGGMSSIFNGCSSLKKLPKLDFLKNTNRYALQSYMYFYSAFGFCYWIKDFENLPIPEREPLTSNVFSSTFNRCSSARNITFETNEDNTPKVVSWKSQTIELGSNSYVGYILVNNLKEAMGYNPDTNIDKEIKNMDTYQALKDDPNAFTCNREYGSFNRISAIKLINTLPDTSAYLATAGGTNTLKLSKAMGKQTEGGAIQNLTEEEIAVATARGWTISFTV